MKHIKCLAQFMCYGILDRGRYVFRSDRTVGSAFSLEALAVKQGTTLLCVVTGRNVSIQK